MSTRTQEIKNMRLISHVDLNGYNNIGEGVDLHRTANGRRIFYMAHESAPKDFTGVDVTDLANPKVVVQTDLDYNHLRSNSLSIVGDTMLVAYQSLEHGQPGAGMGVFDISDPEAPKRSRFTTRRGRGHGAATACGGWMATTHTWRRERPTPVPMIRRTTSST